MASLIAVFDLLQNYSKALKYQNEKGTTHRAQGTEHRAQRTTHRAKGTMHRAQRLQLNA